MIFAAALLALGASGLVAQIVLLRELFVIFGGNEFSIGVVLGNWLLLEALGCALAGRLGPGSGNVFRAFVLIQVLFAAALPACLYAARVLRDIAGLMPGEGFGILAMFWSSLLVLACVSMTHGALFALACLMREKLKSGAGAGGFVYGWETLGTLAGGLVLSFLLLPYFHSFKIVLAVSAMNLSVCLFLLKEDLYRGSSVIVAAFTAVLLAGACVGAFGPVADILQKLSVDRQWPGFNVVRYDNSVYGNVTVLRSAEQTVFMTDGVPAVTVPTPDIAFIEELAHFPLLAHAGPEEVMVLGGGAGGLIHEILKHPVRRIDYAELDPLLLRELRQEATELVAGELSDARVSVHPLDARRLVKHTRHRYDVILVGAGRPSSLQANRLFTREFFSLARARLKPGGILAFGLAGSTAAMEENLARLNACVLRTAAGVFVHVRPIPGDWNLFLASDSGLTAALAPEILSRRFGQRRLHTGFITPRHMTFRLEEQWTRMLQGYLSPFAADSGVNSDFTPRAVLYDVAHDNAMFSPRVARFLAWSRTATLPGLAAALLAVFLALLLAHLKGRDLSRAMVPASLCATGFAGMVYNMSIVFAFQAIYGYVYLWIGVLVSVFMAGAAGGNLLLSGGSMNRDKDLRMFLMLEGLLVFFSMILPLVFLRLARFIAPDLLLKAAFVALGLLAGTLTGAQFPVACRLHGRAGALYAWDLLGGWLGAVAGGVILLPVLGLEASCLCVAILKLASQGLCAAVMEPA